MTTHTLHDCYRSIIRFAESGASKTGFILYAASYAKHGLMLKDALSKAELTHEARTQALYVRSNLQGWRGDEAKAVRLAMDKILGVKK